jgi:DNA-binding CsgD family transcriptional regulator
MSMVSSIYTKARAERAIRDFQHQLIDCDTLSEVKPVLSQVIQKVIGASGIVFLPFHWGITPESDVVLHSEFLDPKEAGAKSIAFLPKVNKELGFIASYQKEKVRTRNVMDYYGQRLVQQRWYYEAFYSCKAERPIAAFMGTKQISNLGYLMITRSGKEPSFVDRDLKLIESIRWATEQRLSLIAQSDEDCFVPTVVLAALASGLPQSCALVDHNGYLVWANKAAEQRMGEDVLSFSGKCFLCSRNSIVENWRCAIQQSARSLNSNSGLSNDVIISRIERPSHDPLYLIIEPSNQSDRHPSLKGLSAREREIAELAAQGYTPLNIGAMLSISVGTVRVHLKSIYRKLHISSRVELALKMNLG